MIEFEVKQNSRGYIVIRKGGEHSQHAHVSTLNGARQLINLIDRGLLPTSKYLQWSCARLLTEEEYKGLRQKRQRYVNVNKGCEIMVLGFIKRYQEKCNHNYVRCGNKARTINTPMICTKCGKIKNDSKE